MAAAIGVLADEGMSILHSHNSVLNAIAECNYLLLCIASKKQYCAPTTNREIYNTIQFSERERERENDKTLFSPTPSTLKAHPSFPAIYQIQFNEKQNKAGIHFRKAFLVEAFTECNGYR